MAAASVVTSIGKKIVKKLNIVDSLVAPTIQYMPITTAQVIGKMNEFDVSTLDSIPESFPQEFIEFCETHKLKPPKKDSKNGKALTVMLHNPGFYFTRRSCEEFVKKFDITTRDSIQLFNKHEQWGVKTSKERGKNYILYPYQLSNKHKMRKNFTFDGTDKQKNEEIDKIKSTIAEDYINVGYSDWQLGHKNPGSTDNSGKNLVLQPPIQAKYRDHYIFFDTLTKMPLPDKLEKMIESKEVTLTEEQIDNYITMFQKMKAGCVTQSSY